VKGKALRRALETSDAYRVGGTVPVPLIIDTTELITPESAYAMLLKNANNRPINWRKVEEYAAVMKKGEWELHAQGIILDVNDNILTGQKRLWAVIYSNASVYMRVSRGNPVSAGRLIDRGVPQSSRDLASRATGKKHSPLEASIARAIRALGGDLRPSVDAVAETIQAHAAIVAALISKTSGTKKTRAVIMIIAAISVEVADVYKVPLLATHIEEMAESLDAALLPQSAAVCWGRGAAFALALEHARRIVVSTLTPVLT
jgi:hypothetical protein